MDDAPDKVRRNLMVVSTAIILLWFLRAPLQGKIFWVLDLSNVEPWRPWAAALAILAYCALRFHTEPSTAKARQREMENFRHHRQAVTQEHLFAHACCILREGGVSTKIKPLTAPDKGLDLISLSITHDESGGHLAPESPLVVLYWAPAGAPPALSKLTLGVFSLHWIDQPKIHLAALMHGKWFKWPALEFGLPYALSFIASLICVWSICISVSTT